MSLAASDSPFRQGLSRPILGGSGPQASVQTCAGFVIPKDPPVVLTAQTSCHAQPATQPPVQAEHRSRHKPQPQSLMGQLVGTKRLNFGQDGIAPMNRPCGSLWPETCL